MSNIRFHESYFEIHPLKKCVWVDRADRCKLCPEIEASFPGSILSEDQEERILLELDDLVDRKGMPPVLFFRTSFNENRDRGLLAVERFTLKLKKWFQAPVVLEMLPTTNLNFLDHAYGIGVDAVMVNLAIFSPDRFQELFPRKQEVIGYDHYWRYFEHAVKVFPRGAVFSQMMVGAEKLADSRAGIRRLIQTGVLPVVDLFGPPRPGFEPVSVGDKLDIVRMVVDMALERGFSGTWFTSQREALAARARSLVLEENPDPGLDLSLKNYIHNFRSHKRNYFRLRFLAELRRFLRLETLPANGEGARALVG